MSAFRRLGMLYRAAAGIAVLATAVGLVVYADRMLETGKNAVALCTQLLIPSLFPFFVVSNLIVGLGYANTASRAFEPLMRRLFHVGGRCAPAFLLGIVGGYPVGAKTAINLYQEGLCSKTEAERLLGFCNNSGPAFILGAVGTGVFASSLAGVLLYGIHVLASVTVGILFRFYKHKEAPEPAHSRRGPEAAAPAPLSAVFVNSVTQAGAGVLRICAFVVLFAVGINLLFTSGAVSFAMQKLGALLAPLGLDAARLTQLLTGFIEITSGLWSLAGASSSLTARLAMAACMLGWAGLCVHAQVLSFIEGSGLALRPYMIGKLLHGALSALYVWLFSLVSPLPAETASILTAQMNLLAYSGFRRSFLNGIIGALLTALLIVALAVCSARWVRPRKTSKSRPAGLTGWKTSHKIEGGVKKPAIFSSGGNGGPVRRT